MPASDALRLLVFEDHRCLADGDAALTAARLSERFAASEHGRLLVFDADSGEQLDVDHSAPPDQLAAQLSWLAGERRGKTEAPASGRGRPKLGVTAREVTLLPRHWQWLAAQPGGASATLRRLVEQARKSGGGRAAQRQAQDRSYRLMSTLGGDLPGFEEACRALFAGRGEDFAAQVEPWPADVRAHVSPLAAEAF